jgi:hypothetical protein
MHIGVRQLDEDDENTAKFEPLLACLFAWKYEADVIKLIKGWLASGLNTGDGGKQVSKNKRTKKKATKQKKKPAKKATRGKATTKSGKRARDVSDEEEDDISDDDDDNASEQERKPIVALRLLGSIMEKDSMRVKLFKRYDLAVGIMSAFESYLTVIEKRFDVSEEDDEEEMPDEILFRVMDCFTRFLIHAIGSNEPQWKDKGEEVFGRLLAWTNDTLLPVLGNDAANDSEEELADAFAFVDQVSFQQPIYVLCELLTLRSLTEVRLSDGKARGGDRH